ncbi:NUDIX hydrolase [Asanoa sp. WMMD1127]|uniref:NUDIX hydrolase n=1 Tax=Asanoa sp. WMMD1127 TaxID=3016107 RepID=UPI0024162733|nr:NUDIX hydrolase [Asanoa sp. WMMD1127]MDG4822539.1 NUDIX hydrolase [Asanoa sp. WMMD1127]
MVDEFAVPPEIADHARRFLAEGKTPVPPRLAATVLLLRETPGAGFEVYVIRRVAAMAFGGMYAFPGGGVDPSDADADLGIDPASLADKLATDPQRAQAIVCAAAREVFEEAGVLLAGPSADTVVGDVSGDDWEAARRALVARERSFADVLNQRDLTLRADLLAPWSRWVTPEFEPRRFDTYFFVAALPVGQVTRDVSGEADHTMWIRPADAVARAESGEVAMLPPTIMTLKQVGACGDIAEVFAAAAGREPAVPVTPTLDLTGNGGPRFRYG